MAMEAHLVGGYTNVRLRICGRWKTYRAGVPYTFNRSQYEELVRTGAALKYFSFQKVAAATAASLPDASEFEDTDVSAVDGNANKDQNDDKNQDDQAELTVEMPPDNNAGDPSVTVTEEPIEGDAAQSSKKKTVRRG